MGGFQVAVLLLQPLSRGVCGSPLQGRAQPGPAAKGKWRLPPTVSVRGFLLQGWRQWEGVELGGRVGQGSTGGIFVTLLSEQMEEGCF